MIKARGYHFIAAVAAVAALSGLAAGCSGGEVAEAPPVVRPVKTIIVGGAVSTEMTFPGIVEAGDKALLSFRVKGRLMDLPIDEGQQVAKGDLIGRLDPRDFQIALERARAEFNKTEADLRRYQRLYEREAIPLSDLELRRSQRDVAKSEVDKAERNLGYTTLRAPFAGQIGRRYVENFMDVQAQQDIVDLNDVQHLEIIVDIPESLVKGVQEGLQAQMFATFSSARDQPFELHYKEASARADPETQTFRVRLSMPQPENLRLLPGMTAEVKVIISQRDSEQLKSTNRLIIPAFAVLGEPDGSGYVWLVDSTTMTVHKRDVQIGEMVGTDQVRLVGGLTGGERVIVAGMNQLAEGMQVRHWVRDRDVEQP